MPNHVTNIIHPVCDSVKFAEIAESIRADGRAPGTVDFGKVIPMPAELDIEASSRGEEGKKMYSEYLSLAAAVPSHEEKQKIMERIISRQPGGRSMFELGRQYTENISRYGHPTWYSWCIENWGTKWNAYDCAEVADGDCEFRFLTAWSGVPEVVSKISEKFPDVMFEYSYADEDIGRNCASFEFRNGRTEMMRYPAAGSREAYELAAAVFDMDLQENGFVLTPDGSSYTYDSRFDAGMEYDPAESSESPER